MKTYDHKGKMKRLHKELNKLDRAIRTHTIPAGQVQGYYHDACSVYMMQERNSILKSIRRVALDQTKQRIRAEAREEGRQEKGPYSYAAFLDGLMFGGWSLYMLYLLFR